MRKVGVYVDAANIGANGGHGLRFDVLRDLACRDGGQAQRLNVYLAYDPKRAEEDPEYQRKAQNYHAAVRDHGYRVTVKQVKRYVDEEGNIVRKANADLDMAVDLLTESERLDLVMLATGDGDFVQVVRALQTKGCRVEVVAFDNVSRELRESADQFINGYLIPNLVPMRQPVPSFPAPPWGTIGARARGVCVSYNAEQRFGFIRMLSAVPTGLVVSNSLVGSSLFLLGNVLPPGVASRLPCRETVLEFSIIESSKPDGLPEARDVIVVSGQ